jgi:hypothetical protein
MLKRIFPSNILLAVYAPTRKVNHATMGAITDIGEEMYGPGHGDRRSV